MNCHGTGSYIQHSHRDTNGPNNNVALSLRCNSVRCCVDDLKEAITGQGCPIGCTGRHTDTIKYRPVPSRRVQMCRMETDATTDRQGWNKEQVELLSRTHFLCEGTILGHRDHNAFVYHSPYSIPMIVALNMLRHAGGQAQPVCGNLYRCWSVRCDFCITPPLGWIQRQDTHSLQKRNRSSSRRNSNSH